MVTGNVAVKVIELLDVVVSEAAAAASLSNNWCQFVHPRTIVVALPPSPSLNVVRPSGGKSDNKALATEATGGAALLFMGTFSLTNVKKESYHQSIDCCYVHWPKKRYWTRLHSVLPWDARTVVVPVNVHIIILQLARYLHLFMKI